MSSYAWGPERKTYLESNQASYVTLNAITNSGAGDERNFVRVREAGTADTRGDTVMVQPGKVYEVYIYFRNSAASAEARGVKVQSYFSEVVDAEHYGEVIAVLYGEGATPARVWDGARFGYRGEGAVELRYVAGSAMIRTAGRANEIAIPDEIFQRGGTFVGYNALDGVLPAGAEYAGYVTYEVVAKSTTRRDFSTMFGSIFSTATGAEVEEGGVGGSGTITGAEAYEAASDIPKTGAGSGLAMIILMGALVAFGWSILRKIKNCDKIGK